MIIHNAWRLDFNLSLPSFETHVRGLRNLIDLARSSRYASSLRFLFTSTIASAQSWNASEKGPYPECVITDASYAVGMGYGEGKYVSERVGFRRSFIDRKLNLAYLKDPCKKWSPQHLFQNRPNQRRSSEWCMGYV